ncbi:Acetyl-CoA acetyltransferase [Streptomyces sp. 2224.1]|nr:acetyl-CoA acetyltransferase [Streptomyces sp. 2321.6]SDR56794.1 Acetyl-CoA acetyltransferase [Streptomyces sp. KS_16]SEB96418.1 Acetyl-CoA acetyltransferase [Streptomyces sp. 2133.1]SED30643.1 Acetyl-CoA acetyltransferase [Streptomyces sp. 2224.1]
MAQTRKPVVPGWFDQDAAGFRLLGTCCRACGAVFFPREDTFCRNPACGGDDLAEVPLSRRGTVWSYTDARYRPPSPYVSDPEAEWRPYALVAVELAEERMVVLGQAAPGVRAADLRVGMEVELMPGTVAGYEGDDGDVRTTWHWRPCGRGPGGVAEGASDGPRAETASLHPPTPRRGVGGGEKTEGASGRRAGGGSGARGTSSSGDVAVLGAGMHPWGKWGRSFVEYGTKAAREALADAGLDWRAVQSVVGADTVRGGYPGYVAGATFAKALGWQGARVTSVYAACASGAQAIGAARAQILSGMAEVALVVGADAAPKGFFTPAGGDRPDDPDWLRFRVLGATNPAYFGLYARRRMALYGETTDDFAQVKVKNSAAGAANPYARYRKRVTAREVAASAVVCDPLRLLDICATSDGAAALVLTSMDFARRHGVTDPVRIRAVSTATPRYPRTVLDLPDIATDSAAAVPEPAADFRASIAHTAYEEAGIGPEDLSLAEVYDLSTALELEWYEDLGLCGAGEAAKLLRDGTTALGGRLPVNSSGGLASFGEAVPAQAIAQVCELTWQLRGQAGARQVADARVGVSANQGLFGHGSAVVAVR